MSWVWLLESFITYKMLKEIEDSGYNDLCVLANVCWFDYERVFQRCTISSLQFRIFLSRRNICQMFSNQGQIESVIFIFSSIYTAFEWDQFETMRERKAYLGFCLTGMKLQLKSKLSLIQISTNYITHFF